MPWFETIKTIEITPEKFVDSCLYDELQEVILLANKKLSLYNATVAEEKKPEKALLKKPKTKKKLLRWTPEEETILRELWPNMRGQDVAFKLKKSYRSVMQYANRLGLSKYATDSRKPARKPKPATEMAERNTDCIGKEINYPIY